MDVDFEGAECEVCRGTHFETVIYGRSHPEFFASGSERICVDCGARYGRWSHRLLMGQEAEPRRGHPTSEGER
jgi:hypothetical protein